jgi:hypothetical protein
MSDTIFKIQPDEIKLGNILSSKGKVIIVENIWDDGVNLYISWEGEKDYTYFEDLEGIPLTEEWLIKLGFEHEKDGEVDEYTINYGRHSLKFSYSKSISYPGDRDYEIYFEFELLGFNRIADCNTVEFVHQLQNLWFCLAGQELKQPEQLIEQIPAPSSFSQWYSLCPPQ